MNFESALAKKFKRDENIGESRTELGNLQKNSEEKEKIIDPEAVLDSMRAEYENGRDKDFKKIFARNKIIKFVAGSLLLANLSVGEAKADYFGEENFGVSRPESIEMISSNVEDEHSAEKDEVNKTPRCFKATMLKGLGLLGVDKIPVNGEIFDTKNKEIEDLIGDIKIKDQMVNSDKNSDYQKHLRKTSGKGHNPDLYPEIRLFSEDSQGKVGLGFRINIPYGMDGMKSSMRNFGKALAKKVEVLDGRYKAPYTIKEGAGIILDDLASALGSSVLYKIKEGSIGNQNDSFEK